MLVHRRVTPPALNSPLPIYTPGWREALRVKCLAQEHNTMSPARARTRTTWSGDECTNHEGTMPPCGNINARYYTITTSILALKSEWSFQYWVRLFYQLSVLGFTKMIKISEKSSITYWISENKHFLTSNNCLVIDSPALQPFQPPEYFFSRHNTCFSSYTGTLTRGE